MLYSDEQVARAQSVNIADYFTSRYEYTRSGNEYHIKGFSGLWVNAENETYVRFGEPKIGGRGLINCLRELYDMTFPEAIKEIIGEEPAIENGQSIKRDILIREHSEPIKFEAPKKEFVMPERADNNKRVFAYLINQRKISPQIISSLIQQGLLYQDKNGNAIFLHKDKNGNAVGAEIQGTLSEKRYKGVAAGTSHSMFRYDIGKPQKAYVFESSIDMLSYIQLHNSENAAYISMAGLKDFAIEQLAKEGLQIISCIDNDDAGRNFNQKCIDKGIGLQSLLSRQKIQYDIQQSDDIVYAKSDVNGETNFFFQSKEDYASVKCSDELFGRTFIAVHATEYFTIDKECEREQVKDFNELLCKRSETKVTPIIQKQSLKQLITNAKNNVPVEKSNDDNRSERNGYQIS